MPLQMPAGDLARTINHEANSDWPFLLEIVSYVTGPGRKGKRHSVTISAEEWFGVGGHSAPMTGDRLFQIINTLRKKR